MRGGENKLISHSNELIAGHIPRHPTSWSMGSRGSTTPRAYAYGVLCVAPYQSLLNLSTCTEFLMLIQKSKLTGKKAGRRKPPSSIAPLLFRFLLWPSADMATVPRQRRSDFQAGWLVRSVVPRQPSVDNNDHSTPPTRQHLSIFASPSGGALGVAVKPKSSLADPLGRIKRPSHEHARICLPGSHPGLDTDRSVPEVQKVLGRSVSVWRELHRCHRRYG